MTSVEARDFMFDFSRSVPVLIRKKWSETPTKTTIFQAGGAHHIEAAEQLAKLVKNMSEFEIEMSDCRKLLKKWKHFL